MCCDSACTGQCEACDLASSAGVCAAVSGAPRGDRAACASDGSTCAGACDGIERDACTYPDASAPCGAASCAGGVATGVGSCDGAGGCSEGSLTPCAPFACSLDACLGSCDGDEDCASGFVCAAGACEERLVVPDAGPLDGGEGDGGAIDDGGGVLDGGGGDAGAMDDAGVLDAGEGDRDSGATGDGGATADSGATDDAGALDAAGLDGNLPLDAGAATTPAGCGCRAYASSRPEPRALIGALAALLLAWRRRARRARR